MARESRGNRIVLLVFAVLLSVAGVFGFVIGLIRPEDLRTVEYLGLVAFEPTPLGLAAWGMLTVGTVLGVGLALVVAVSRYVDAERPA